MNPDSTHPACSARFASASGTADSDPCGAVAHRPGAAARLSGRARRFRNCFGVGYCSVGLLAPVFAVLLSMVMAMPAEAEVVATVEGELKSVESGDMLTFRVNGEDVAIRLDAIDAPNEGQANFAEARDALEEMLSGNTIRVDLLDTVQEGRPRARVWLDRISVNKAMVRGGWAWHDARQAKFKSIAAAQQSAKTARRGLWQDPQAVAPWEFAAKSPAEPDATARPMPGDKPVQLTADDKQAITSVAQGFLRAASVADEETAKKFLTKKAIAGFDKQGSMEESEEERSFKLGQITGTSNAAKIEATLIDANGEQQAQLLVKPEGDQWRVYGMAMVLGEDGPSMELDFEHPEKALGGLVEGLGEELGEGLGEGLGKVMKEGLEGAFGELLKEKPEEGPPIELSVEDVKAITSVTKGFLQASVDGDADAAKKLMTEKASAGFDKQGGLSESDEERAFELGQVVGTATGAKVEATLSEAGEALQGAVLLKKQGDQWRVYGMAMVLGEGGPSMELNFEEPEKALGGLMEGLAEGLGEALGEGLEGAFGPDKPKAPLVGVSLEQFAATWQMNDAMEGQTAGDALEKLAGDLGLKLKRGSDVEAQLDQQVTLAAAESRSRLEAIEAICQQAGLYPVYGKKNLSCKECPRPLPVTFSGPFMIEVKMVEEYPPYGTGTLTMMVRSAALPAPIQQLLDEDQWGGGPFIVQEISDADGNDLMDTTSGIMFFPDSDSILAEFPEETPLRGLWKNVQQIDSLLATIALTVPTKVESIKLEKIVTDAEKTAGEITVKLTDVQEGDPCQLEFEITGADSEQLQVIPLDAKGQPMTVFGSGGDGFDKKVNYSLTIDGMPAAIAVQVITQQEDLEYDVELTKIPLKDFEKMPEGLEEVTFEGHDAPVSFKFRKITRDEGFKKVLLEVTNHSNKDIRELDLTLSYLDSDGEELDDHNTTQGPKQDFNAKGPGIVVAAGKSAEIEATAFFMPEETKRVGVTVNSVSFADADSWDAEE